MACRTECWMTGSPQISSSAGDEGSLPEQTCVGHHSFWGLPRFGLGHPWADCLLTANEHRSHCIVFPRARVFFFCYFLVLALMWHNAGPYLWIIQSSCVGISPVSAFTILFQKRKTKASKLLTLQQGGITLIWEQLGPRDLLTCSYFFSTGSFQRKGRGNWCVKINYGLKKIIFQTTCRLQPH